MSTPTTLRSGLAVATAALLALMLTPVGLAADSARFPDARWSGGVESWVTDLATDQRLAPQPRAAWRGGPGRPDATIVVDPTRRYQTMVGFGASMTDSSAYVLSRLPEPIRRQAMRDLFSPTEGIGLSMLRQPMGASDFTVGHAYSYDDQAAGQTDPDLSEFSIRRDRGYLLPRLREAYALNPRLSFLASPWSAPGWMKTTDSLIGGSLLERYHRVYADYFVHFLRAYRAAGVPIEYVTMQNEPLYTPPDYPGMLVWPEQAATFVGRHLGPALDRSGLDTEILGYDHNWDIPDYPEALYAEQRASQQIAGTAWHCYAGDVVAQSVTHNNYPHAQAFQTECSGGGWQDQLGDPFALTMASVIGVPRNWGQSVVLWNLALDQRNGPFIGGCDVCRGVVTVNDDDTVTKELDYWALGHASRFVSPGAVRIGSTSLRPTAEGGLTNVAFANRDGSHVLIAHNGGEQASSVDVQVGARHFRTTLAAGAAATYRWVGPDRDLPAADVDWVDLDYGPGPDRTPGGRLVASVSPEVVGALSAVKLADQWLAYSRPYGSELVSGPARTLSRAGWKLAATGMTPIPDTDNELTNMLDGDPRTRWNSGAGQDPSMSLTLDLGREQTLTEIALDARDSIGDYLRRYRVQVSPDGVAWSDVATGPGRAGLTTVVLPPTTTRHLRLVSGASSLSSWSIHELNLRHASGENLDVVAGRSLVSARGELPNGTEVVGYRNAGQAPAAVSWPVSGMGYSYSLPPTAAVTFALLRGPPRATTSEQDRARSRTGS